MIQVYEFDQIKKVTRVINVRDFRSGSRIAAKLSKNSDSQISDVVFYNRSGVCVFAVSFINGEQASYCNYKNYKGERLVLNWYG